MSNYKSDCRKFQPNIFNKSKCTTCFRAREEHSAEALESNRASRKVSKCGYLFVAPDWDFSVPLNRTKRWQRRWFVLYDDGELTYSVDDHPATIPQGVINMTRVQEVAEAEDVTGNQYSLAITAPERITFVKGTCKEESRWWLDVLSVFPRAHKSGRHKRNATFPGIKSTTILKQSMVPRSATTTLAPTTFESPLGGRVRFHSCTTDPVVGNSNSLPGRPPSAPVTSEPLDCDDVFPTKDPSTSTTTPISPPTPIYHSTPLSSLPASTRMNKENTPPYTEDYTDNPPTSESPPTQDKLSHKLRSRRAVKREARGLTQPRSKSEVTFPSCSNMPTARTSLTHHSHHRNTSTTQGPPPDPPPTTANTSYDSLATCVDTTPYTTSYTNTSAFSSPHSDISITPTHGVIDPLTSVGHGVRKANITLTSSLSSLSSFNSPTTPTGMGNLADNSLSNSSVSGNVSGGLGVGGSVGGVLRSDGGVHVPTRPHQRPQPDKPGGGVSRQLMMTDLEESKREEKLKDIADSITRLRGSHYRVSKSGHGNVAPTRECDPQDEVDGGIDSNKSTMCDTTDSLTEHNIRGSPDGCVLETGPVYTTNPDLPRVDLPAEDLLYIKKGWLMKQTLTQEWNKFWFVLRGTGLMFYRDPSAEDNGILDGIIDLSIVKSVEEYEVQRNYGFTCMTWEEKKYVFSAVTSGIRANWVQALRNAANLKEDKNRPLSLGEKIEREISAKRDRHNSQGSNIESIAAERDKGSDIINSSGLSINTHRYIISSDEEYRTASEPSTGSQSINNTEDYFEWERVRSRSNSRSRSSKRSKSSPPNSRRGTRDDFPIMNKGEVLNPCFSETGSVHSITDLDDTHPEKDSSATTLTGTGDALLVDLLETQVESLKAKLEQTQADYLNLHKENSGLKTRLKVSGISIPFKNSPSGKYHQDQDILQFQSSDVNILEQSPSSLSPAKLELKLSEAKEAIASLTADLARLHKKVKVCEGDLERSENEVEKLRRDKGDAANEAIDLRRRVASLEMQIKELLDRVEEQEHDLVEKTACANQLNEMRKKYNELLQRVSGQNHSPDKVDWKQHYEDLEKRFFHEREEWEERLSSQELRLVEANVNNTAHKDETMRKMTRSLKEAEQRINKLVVELEEERSIRRTKKKETELDKQVEQLSVDLTKMRDNLKSEKSEVYKWKDLVKELRSLLDGKNEDIEKKREEVDKLRENMKTTQKELDHTADRLHRGIEENESLCTRIRELERQAQFNDKIRQSSSTLSISSSRERFSSKKNLPRMDSLSDLTNVNLLVEPRELDKDQLAEEYSELGIRFEKAVNEIRALRREVRESQNQHDELDLLNVKLKQDLKTQEDDFTSQHNLLADRVQDLSNKLSASEKQVRTLKQKLSRTESRDRRRTLSLKGKESFALSRDMEQKLSQLEAKVEALLQEGTTEVVQDDTKEQANGDQAMKMPKRSRSFDESTKSSRLRRKSLDSPVNSDSMKTIVRLNTLEAKVGCISGEEKNSISSSSSVKSSSRPKSPTHPASPLRSPLRSPSMQRKNIRSPRATPEKTVKLNRSDSESKILRERLSGLEKVLTSLQTQLTECVAWAGSVECVCSCGAPGMSSLKQSLSCAVRITQLRHSPKDLTAAPRVRPMAVRMQDMLREKLTDLYNRRDHLKNCGKWTRDSQLKLFAERLSYETLVLTQVAQVMQAVHRPESYQSSVKLQELIEAHRKLSFLEKKLTNPDFDMDTMSPLDFYTSLLAEKLVVQGELASNLSQNSSASQRLTDNSPPQLSQTCLDLQKRLLDRERSLANLVTNYKEGKLHEIAIVMARETISGTSPPHDDSILLEELRMREAWSIAQDLLTQDLVNTEAAQSLMRLCELLTPAESSDSVCSQISIMTASTMERWQTASEESLRQEMEEAVFTLSNKYEEVLAQYRAGDMAIVNSVTIPMEGLLAEFAAVVAQKAMIDGQLAVVQNENESPSSASEPLAIVEETRDNLGAASDVVASEAHLLMFLGGCDSSMENLVQPALDQSEFTFLFNKMGVACNSDITKLILQAASQPRTEVFPLTKSVQGSIQEDKGKDDENSYTSLPSPTKSLSSPKTRRKSESRKYRRASDITGMADGCRQCEEMRQEIAKLKRSLDSKRAKEREAECKHCVEYINKLKALEQDHRIALSALNTQHGQDMSRLREQLGHEPPTRDSDDELTELKRRLSLLEEGYEAQIDALKKQYQDALQAAGTSHPDLCEENIRQRYQVEITQLRGLCEKGLGAMENSHKRMLTELEEKHRREMAALQAEKEQALAEETQATLAALDAMRKAHEAEVQREIAKFKEEFIRKMTSGHDIGAIHKEHEAEMEDIRTEILSLSEKYSIKCLESAALESKLDGVNKQLTDANKQIFDLEARNKQLKTHLSAKVSQGQQDTYKDSSSQLGLRESELVLCNEEIARLNQQLQQTKSHEADLGELCRQLGHFLKAERQLRTDEVSSLREKLEHIILTAATMQDQHSDVTTNGNSKDKSPFRRGASLNASHSKDLIRSPSCPRLSGFSSFLSVGPTQGGITGPASTTDLPSPLAGMVASRKKVFETTPVKGSVEIL